MSPKSYVGSSAARRKIETREPNKLILYDSIVFQHCGTFPSLRSRILTSNRAKVIEHAAITRAALSELKKARDIDPRSHKRLNDESSRQRESQAGLAHTGHTISPNPI